MRFRKWMTAAALWLTASAALAQGTQFPAGTIWANDTASQRPGKVSTVTAILDRAFGSTRGAILERGVSGWVLIAPGTSGLPFTSNGTGADPAYQRLGFGGVPQGIANSIYINPTAGTANMQALAIPSCANDGVHALVYLNATGLQCAALSTTGRVRMTVDTTFYVETVGTDTAGCGLASGASACRTRAYMFSILSADYDLAGHVATIQFADGTYTDGFTAYGSIVGQQGPQSLIFQGNCGAGATNNVLIQPAAAAGYAYGGAYGAQFSIFCQKMDMTTQIRAGPASTADMVTAGQASKITIGKASLFGVRSDVSFGCLVNPYNHISAGFDSVIQFDNDFEINPGSCQVSTTGTVTNGSATITAMATTTNIVQYMGVLATGVPNDAYVNSKTVNSVTLGCLYTTPCQASSTTVGTAITTTGGGQSFLDMGNGAQAYVNTNGQPDYSVVVTLNNYPFYTSGFLFINGLSAINAQALTFVNPDQAHGRCSAIRQLSNIDTGLQGIPYLPCNAQVAEVSKTPALTAAAGSFTVGSATGIVQGMIVTDVAATTATFTAGTSTMVVASATGILAGSKPTGAGILAGAVVTNVAGTTITVGGCGAGPKCITGSPLYINEAASPVWFSNSYMSGASVVTGINGTTISISDTITNTSAGTTVWFQSRVTGNSVYN